MPLECAHCGARAEDGAKRCPSCLRATSLVAVAEAPPATSSRRRGPLVAGLALLLLAGLAVPLALRRTRPGDAAPSDPRGATEAPELFLGGPRTEALASALGAGDASARARALGERLAAALRSQRLQRAQGPAQLAPPRPAEALAQALEGAASSPGPRVSSLELARFAAVLLRNANPTVVELTRGPREAEPADPTALLGAFSVQLGEQVLDWESGALVPASARAPRALSAQSLRGALASQEALALLELRQRDRAMHSADEAARLWTESPTPLAVQAWVTFAVVGNAGPARLALSAAVALRDDAPLSLLRARLELRSGALREAVGALGHAGQRGGSWGLGAVARMTAERLEPSADAGEPCDALSAVQEPWAEDLRRVCRGDDAQAAQRLLDGQEHFLLRAWGLARGATAASLGSEERAELARWVALLGQPERAAALVGDGGA